MLVFFFLVLFPGFNIDNGSTDLFYSFHLTFESFVECLMTFPCSFMRRAISKTVEMFLSGNEGKDDQVMTGCSNKLHLHPCKEGYD